MATPILVSNAKSALQRNNIESTWIALESLRLYGDLLLRFDREEAYSIVADLVALQEEQFAVNGQPIDFELAERIRILSKDAARKTCPERGQNLCVSHRRTLQ